MSVVYFIFQQTMFFSIPLLIVALGGMFSERSGVVNIALEGIMTMGAFTSILFINLTGKNMSGQGQLLIAIVIAMSTGVVFSRLCSHQHESRPDHQWHGSEHVRTGVCDLCCPDHSGSTADSIFQYIPY